MSIEIKGAKFKICCPYSEYQNFVIRN